MVIDMSQGDNGKVEFRIVTNMMTGRPMVEVWQDGKCKASIYGHEDGVQIVSKYLNGVEQETGYPPAVVVHLNKVAGGDTVR